MGRARRAAVAAVAAAALVISPALSSAAPLTSDTVLAPVGFFRFCAEAQLQTAGIDEAALAEKEIEVVGRIYDDFDDFTKSKSYVDPDAGTINISQYVSYRDEERTQPEQIRCKLRTAESLDEGAWPDGSPNNQAGFEVPEHYGFGPLGDGLVADDLDAPCSELNAGVVSAVWATLTPEQQTASPWAPAPDGSTLITVPDDPALTGGQWVVDFPALQLDGEVLEVPSRSLFSPTGGLVGAAFEGAYYCTSPAPDYLRAVLLGDATVS